MARNTVREERPLARTLHDAAPEYKDGLVIKIEISSAKSVRPILLSGHNVQDFELDLRSSGFTGALSFFVSDDTALLSEDRDALIAMLRTPVLLKLHLSIQAYRVDQDINTKPQPLEIYALVTERALVEHVAKLGNAPLSYRHYHLRFADAAQVMWRQHFPLELFTHKSLRQVIDQYCTTDIKVEYLDTEITQTKPMIFIGCDAEHRRGERASFYDLLMWRLDEMRKVLIYDYTRRVYQIHAVKPNPVIADLIPHDIQQISVYYPDYPRYQKFVLNDFVEAVRNQVVTNLDKELPIRHDHLFNTEIVSEFDKEVLARTRAFNMPRPEFLMYYRTFPTKPYPPSVGIDFKLDALDLAADDLAIPYEAATLPCRVYRIHISGRAAGTDVRDVYDGLVPATFLCKTAIWLEQREDPELRLPAYVLPKYPVGIEGRVVSEVGAVSDETYQFYPETLTMQPKYKVMIPLWGNQIITTPYHPNTLPGHFYFPAYKYERVLIDMFFDRAMIVQFREWRATAPMPQATQGDHLLLGKTPLNRTSVQHFYEGERPIFQIERLNQFDNELVKIAEGNLLLQVGTPPLVVLTGTAAGRHMVLPAGLAPMPPRGAPPLPGVLPGSTSPPLKPGAPGIPIPPTSPAVPSPSPSPSPATPPRKEP